MLLPLKNKHTQNTLKKKKNNNNNNNKPSFTMTFLLGISETYRNFNNHGS